MSASAAAAVVAAYAGVTVGVVLVAGRAGLRQINALSSCANLTIVELNFATSLLDAWPLASCTKLKRVDLTGCRALPADSVKNLGRARPTATILG